MYPIELITLNDTTTYDRWFCIEDIKDIHCSPIKVVGFIVEETDDEVKLSLMAGARFDSWATIAVIPKPAITERKLLGKIENGTYEVF